MTTYNLINLFIKCSIDFISVYFLIIFIRLNEATLVVTYVQVHISIICNIHIITFIDHYFHTSY